MNIVITGAGSGIGFEMVRYLARQEEHQIMAVARTQSNLERLRDLCVAESGKEIAIRSVDLSDQQVLDQWVSEARSHFGKVDRLVNNAGTLYSMPFETMSTEQIVTSFRVNTLAPIFIIQGLIPSMGPDTHVVNIGSMGGFQGSSKFPGLAVYSSSKAALANLTECLAEEYKDRGIHFNCLALGAVQTEMLANAFPGYDAPVSAENMAVYIANFCLNGHRLFNGKVLPVAYNTP